MISGKTIICLASGWNYHPTSKHHVMRQLSQHNDVIWVNWHCSRRPQLQWSDLRHMVSRLSQIQQGAQQASDAITVLTPWQIPLPESRAARTFNTKSVCRAIKKVLRRLPNNQPIQLWSFAPDVADLVGQFNEEAVIYYCVDAFSEFAGYNRELIERRERELIDKSSVVITTSTPLYEDKRSMHPHVHLVEHGVDHSHLSKAMLESTSVPADIANLPRPIFGFVGLISEWVDLELIAGLARQRPGASIVMIGPKSGPSRGSKSGSSDRIADSFASLPNVHWLGPRDHQTLPNYLKAFDVGLIPFCHTALTHCVNPIKLHEYLAAGVPTVSTSMPAVKPVHGSVWLADDAISTAHCCEEALQHNSLVKRLARSQSMLAHSWPRRLETISTIVESAMSSAHSPHPTYLPHSPHCQRPSNVHETVLGAIDTATVNTTTVDTDVAQHEPEPTTVA